MSVPLDNDWNDSLSQKVKRGGRSRRATPNDDDRVFLMCHELISLKTRSHKDAILCSLPSSGLTPSIFRSRPARRMPHGHQLLSQTAIRVDILSINIAIIN